MSRSEAGMPPSVPLGRIRFEPMRVRDLNAVMAIEEASFSTPWSRAAYHRELIVNGYATYLVGRLDGRLVSYGGMWVVLDEAHVTNIAVHPEYRRAGVGRLTMKTLERRALQLGASRMTLEVRVSNHAARRLYDSLGFRGTGIRRNYYSDTREDAIVMWKDLAGAGDDETDGHVPDGCAPEPAPSEGEP